jgi:hypothetical protein
MSITIMQSTWLTRPFHPLPTGLATISHFDSKVQYLSPITHAFTCSISVVVIGMSLWGTTLSTGVQHLCNSPFVFTITISSHFPHWLTLYHFFLPSPFRKVISYGCNLIVLLGHNLCSLLGSLAPLIDIF